MLFASCWLLAGCAGRTSREKVGGAEYRVDDIHIEGNEALSDKEILEYLNLSETKWFPLPKRRYFYEGYVPVDQERIVELYAAHGYYDAKVVDFRVEQERDKVVDLVFVVEEGDPVIVVERTFVWPDGVGKGPDDPKAKPDAVQEHCEMKEQERFDIEEMQAAETALATALKRRGYAYAEVVGRAEVDRIARTAKVQFEVRPGPWVRIGRIEINGLKTVPKDLVMNEVERYEGKPYSPARIEHIEESVYGMEVFRSVAVTLPEKPQEVVDLTVNVEEAQPRRIRLGVGIGVESNRWSQWVAAQYSDANLFGRLYRFDLNMKVGYAELPAIYRPEDHGPIFKLSPRLRKKGLLEKQLMWSLEPTFEVGIWEGYQFYSPENRIGVSRFFTRFIETGISHTVRFVDFFDVDPTLSGNRTILGLDYRDPYLVSYIGLDLWFHITDRLMEPQNGVVIGANYNLAGGIFGGQYDFNRITPEVRAYYTPLKRRLQFAARAQAGFILPFGDEPGAPFDLKYYLGGASTMRGWGLRRLAPYVEECDEDGDCDRVPVGGNTMALGNFEVRARTWRDLWVVAFLDVGDVQPGTASFAPNQWNYAMGPGVRYYSPIGAFRLDLGFRLNEDPRFDHEPIWALHFGLGEAF